MNKVFDKGEVYTVIVTPFDEEDKIIYSDFDNLINYQIKNGVNGIILLGTTSESPTIDSEEQQEIVDYVWNRFNGQIKIVVGIGGNNTKKVIEFGRFCIDKCNAFMVTVPNYNKPTQNGIFEHFLKIAQDDILKNKEIIIYNIPSRCGINMDPDEIIGLYNICENITAIKEASGSLTQIRKIKERCNINIYSGDDLNILPIMSLGGVGVISVASNIMPKEICELVNLCNNNNFSRANSIFYQISELIENLFLVSNPIPIKYVLFKNGLISNDNMRLPLTRLIEHEDSNVIKKLNNLKIQVNKELISNY